VVQEIPFLVLLLFSLHHHHPRSLVLTFFNFLRPHGFKASVHLGWVPSLVILHNCAILGIEQRV